MWLLYIKANCATAGGFHLSDPITAVAHDGGIGE
jgi:hypothetical protein